MVCLLFSFREECGNRLCHVLITAFSSTLHSYSSLKGVVGWCDGAG